MARCSDTERYELHCYSPRVRTCSVHTARPPVNTLFFFDLDDTSYQMHLREGAILFSILGVHAGLFFPFASATMHSRDCLPTYLTHSPRNLDIAISRRGRVKLARTPGKNKFPRRYLSLSWEEITADLLTQTDGCAILVIRKV